MLTDAYASLWTTGHGDAFLLCGELVSKGLIVSLLRLAWEMDYGSCIAGVGLWALNRRAHIMDCRIYPNTVPYYEVSDLSEIGWNKGLACGHLP